MRQEDTATAYQDIRYQHYYFFLFYANTAIALIAAYAAWFIESRPYWQTAGKLGVALALVVAVMYASARNALGRFDEKATRILGLVKAARKQ